MSKLILGLLFSTLSFSAFAQSLNQMAFEALLRDAGTLKVSGTVGSRKNVASVLASALPSIQGARTSISNECERKAPKLLSCQLVVSQVAINPEDSADLEGAYILNYKVAIIGRTNGEQLTVQGPVRVMYAE